MNIKSYIDEYTKGVNVIKELDKEIQYIKDKITETINHNQTVYFMGNGGSTADCEHWAAELVGRFKKDRPGLKAVSLTNNTSTLCSISNDFSYEHAFLRQVETFCSDNDLLIAITTSGNSKNLVKAIDTAKEKKCFTIGLLGRDGGVLKDKVDFSIIVPLKTTGSIQVCHSMIYHIICELIDDDF